MNAHDEDGLKDLLQQALPPVNDGRRTGTRSVAGDAAAAG